MSQITGHHVPIDYHHSLLSDPWRTALWGRAIKRLVSTDDKVLDVGTGLGLMAILAARQGASVTAVESAWVAQIARHAIERAGLSRQITLHHDDLAALPAEPVDLILADFVGRMLPDATMLRAVRSSRAWCGPSTRFAPSRVELLAAPVADVAMPALDRFRHPLLGVDLSGALPAAWSTAWGMHLSPSALLTSPEPLGELIPPDLPDGLEAELRFEAPRHAELRGLLGWFRAELAPGVTLDTGPGYRTFWGQTLWPVPATVLEPGDEIQLRWSGRSEPGGIAFRWEVTVLRGATRILEHVGDNTDAPSAPITAAPPPKVVDGGALLHAGYVDLATPELLRALDAGLAEEPLRDLVVALAHRGEHTPASEALELFEQHFGPHPSARRG
ncbi:MAG: class I SAM-dependent methyltransferase [Deltaproteobacteria bacterium]|nr:MAG: class I SAM-dependent methyltransferase [Deltaproteobacteria bacterium]